MAFPLQEVCRAVGVAQEAVLCVGHEPLFGLLEELLELLGGECVLAFLLVDGAQIAHLGIVDALVVDLRQRVELLTQLFHLVGQGLVSYLGQLVEVGILRMQREDGYAAVGI